MAPERYGLSITGKENRRQSSPSGIYLPDSATASGTPHRSYTGMSRRVAAGMLFGGGLCNILGYNTQEHDVGEWTVEYELNLPAESQSSSSVPPEYERKHRVAMSCFQQWSNDELARIRTAQIKGYADILKAVVAGKTAMYAAGKGVEDPKKKGLALTVALTVGLVLVTTATVEKEMAVDTLIRNYNANAQHKWRSCLGE